MLSTLRPSARPQACARAFKRQLYASQVAAKQPHFEAIDNFSDDDLFSGALSEPNKQPLSHPQDLQSSFTRLYEFVTARIGKNPAIPSPPLRQSALVRLIAAAKSEEQLRQVMTTLERWRDGGRPFPPTTSAHFLGRCINLKQPQVAIEILVHRPKYSLDLPSLQYARGILHSFLRTSRPSTDTESAETTRLGAALSFTSLFPKYNLPPVTSDLVSTISLLRFCINDGSEAALAAATELLVSLRAAETEGTLKWPDNSNERAGTFKSLAVILKALSGKVNADHLDWLDSLREGLNNKSVA